MIGRYGRDGISLAAAREKYIDARRAVKDGRSPAQDRQREKRRLKEAKSFGRFSETWFAGATMADSTKAMRRAIYDRDIAPTFRRRLLHEIKPEDPRQLCLKVKERGAPATAIHVRDIVKQVFAFAILHGEEDLRSEFPLSAAVAVRCRCPDVAGDLQQDYSRRCREGAERRTASGAFHRSRPSANRLDPAQ